MARCFVSVDIKDEGVLDMIASVQERLAIDGVKPVERENLHFTLKFLGELDNDQIGLIDRKLAGIKSVPKFKIRMVGVGAFPNMEHINIIWVGGESAELIELAHMIRKLTEGAGDERAFTPHLTIARVKWVRDKEELIRVVQKIKGIELGTVSVSEFNLKHSTLGPDHPTYTILKSYMLGGPA